jgi:hypothetical protein
LFGRHCPVPGNIYYDTEPAKLALLIYNTAGTNGTAKVNYTITDLFDRQVDKGTVSVDLSKGRNIEREIQPFHKKRGIFRIPAGVEGCNAAPAELVYCVLPPNKHLGEMCEARLPGHRFVAAV